MSSRTGRGRTALADHVHIVIYLLIGGIVLENDDILWRLRGSVSGVFAARRWVVRWMYFHAEPRT